MPKSKKRATFRIVMEPEGGGTHPDDPTRKLVRVMDVFAVDEAAAREYAIESAMAVAAATDDSIYRIVTVTKN